MGRKRQPKADAGSGYCLWKFKEGTSLEKLEGFAEKLFAEDSQGRYIDVGVNQNTEGSYVVSFSFVLEKGENLFWFSRRAKDVFRTILGGDSCSLEMFEVRYENSLGPVGSSTTNYVH